MRIVTLSLVTLAMLLVASSAALAFKSVPDNQKLFRRGCYMEDSQFTPATAEVCGYCRNTGNAICCNAFSETNAYSCTAADMSGGSGTGRSISEAVAGACGCK